MSTDSQTLGRTTPTDSAGVMAALAELAPRFRERSAATEARRSLSDESVADLVAAGAARMHVPVRFGGLGLSIRDYVDAVATVAAGCPSTGWCAGLMIDAPDIVAAYPVEAQEAVWADGPDVVMAGTALGLTATRVPGGFSLSGRSPFASGSTHAQWLFMGGPIAGEGPPEFRFFLVPTSAVTVEDTWQMAAMRGTGSNTVITDDVFVADAFTLTYADAREGTGPGTVENPEPRFRVPFAVFQPLVFGATIQGAAQATYDATVAALAKKRTPSGGRVADSEILQLAVSFAGARIDTALVLLHGIADRADSGEAFSIIERARMMRDLSFAATLAVEAVDSLVEAAGTSGFATTSMIQQGWRDVHFAAAHQSLSKRTVGSRFGRLELGVEDLVPPLFY